MTLLVGITFIATGTLNPVNAFAIAGNALKNIKFNIPAAKEGGILSGPSSGFLAMLHGTEVVTPIGKVGDIVNSGPVVIAGDWVIQGEALRFLMANTEKKRGRR